MNAALMGILHGSRVGAYWSLGGRPKRHSYYVITDTQQWQLSSITNSQLFEQSISGQGGNAIRRNTESRFNVDVYTIRVSYNKPRV